MRIATKPSIVLFVLLVLFACNNSPKNTEVTNLKDTLENVVTQFPPLITGDFEISNNDFGETIELKGAAVSVDHIFRVAESQMIATKDLLVVKNLGSKNLFMAFTLPNVTFIKEFGVFGKGPNEFVYPRLVYTSQKEPFCYVFNKDALYSIDKSFELKPTSIPFPKMNYTGDLQMYSFSDSLFYFIDNIPRGKSINEFKIEKDTTTTKTIVNLAFSEKHKSWAAYIGDFGANKEKDRLVYAYKYFRRIAFFDTDGVNQRTLRFKSEQTKTGTDIEMLGPDNVTHYWGISAQKNYVYLLYSGRTPIEVGKELKKSSGYIFVEQYDWNGNPVRRFKLDHWGYFCINDEEDKIYQFSTSDENPIIVYNLPK
jgi:hypothetical protein